MSFKIAVRSASAVLAAAVVLTSLCGCAGNTPETVSDEVLNGEVKMSELVDFIVEVDSGREPVILQLSDPQIIDASQKRTENRLGKASDEYWAKDKKNERCYNYIRDVVSETSPDLILMTGDIVYGDFDDDGSCLTGLVDFMESLNVYWAPVIGNHEAASAKGIDWQCKQLENAPHCLFRQRDLSGNGNYTVGISQGEKLTRVFFMVDSNGYSDMSDESLENGHSYPAVGIRKDQIAWYTSAATSVLQDYPRCKISFAWHIPFAAFTLALTDKYGYDENNFKLLDLNELGEDGDFGIVNEHLRSGWDSDFRIWNGLKELGTDSIFVGHYHGISSSIVYDGVRLQFGQKSSCYDAANYVSAGGKYVLSYTDEGKPVVGGTVFNLDDDGIIKSPRIVLCENEY